MKTIDIIKRAGRNLRRAKMRTFLTSVAIAVGGFAIMASLMARFSMLIGLFRVILTLTD